MLNRLLSHDTPRSRVLALLLLALLLALVFTPFALPGVKALNVAAKVVVFTVLVASFDVLLGYSGMVSFAHTMFFGIGAYGQAIALSQLGPSWSSVGLGLLAALLLSAALSLLMGLFSLRVRAIFFAMISLAVASAFQTLASQLSNLTGGEDGLSFKVPALLSPSSEFFDEPLWGVTLDGRLLCYYLLLVLAVPEVAREASAGQRTSATCGQACSLTASRFQTPESEVAAVGPPFGLALMPVSAVRPPPPQRGIQAACSPRRLQ